MHMKVQEKSRKTRVFDCFKAVAEKYDISWFILSVQSVMEKRGEV